MLRVGLWRVPIGDEMDRVFDEVVNSYQWALSTLGHRVLVTPLEPDPSAFDLILVVGANMVPPTRRLPAGSIVLNFEQSPLWRAHLPSLYAGHRIWNYDAVAHQRFEAMGLDSRLVPFGWTPALQSYRSLPRTETNDIFFVGWLNEERARRLDRLRGAGLRVMAPGRMWGADRAQFIAHSKVVLSMRSFDQSPFMSVRIYPVWAMGKPVLSETFVGREHHPGIEQALALFDSDDDALVEAALSLCHDGPRRAALAAAGTAYAKAHPMLPAIEQALAAL